MSLALEVFTVERHPESGDLYLTDPRIMEALEAVADYRDGCSITIRANEDDSGYVAETRDPEHGVDEWGNGRTVEEALRYCLGNAIG